MVTRALLIVWRLPSEFFHLPTANRAKWIRVLRGIRVDEPVVGRGGELQKATRRIDSLAEVAHLLQSSINGEVYILDMQCRYFPNSNLEQTQVVPQPQHSQSAETMMLTC